MGRVSARTRSHNAQRVCFSEEAALQKCGNSRLDLPLYTQPSLTITAFVDLLELLSWIDKKSRSCKLAIQHFSSLSRDDQVHYQPIPTVCQMAGLTGTVGTAAGSVSPGLQIHGGITTYLDALGGRHDDLARLGWNLRVYDHLWLSSSW